MEGWPRPVCKKLSIPTKFLWTREPNISAMCLPTTKNTECKYRLQWVPVVDTHIPSMSIGLSECCLSPMLLHKPKQFRPSRYVTRLKRSKHPSCINPWHHQRIFIIYWNTTSRKILAQLFRGCSFSIIIWMLSVLTLKWQINHNNQTIPTIPYYVITCHTMPYYAIPCHTMLYRAILCYFMAME